MLEVAAVPDGEGIGNPFVTKVLSAMWFVAVFRMTFQGKGPSSITLRVIDTATIWYL